MDKIAFRQVTTVEELISFWPFFQRVSPTDNNEMLLHRMLSALDGGLLLAVYTGGQMTAYCSVSRSDSYALIQSLPSDGANLGFLVLGYIKTWAKENGVKEIQVVSDRLNGSNYRYFEHTLGFHRKSVIFSLEV